MAATFLDTTITSDAMDVQHEMGSDTLWQMLRSCHQADCLDDSGVGMIATRDSLYLATASQSGQPYIQCRGSPVGFLYLLDDIILTMADFDGNHQYVTTGSPRGSVRACLFLMDYPRRARLKIHTTVEAAAAENHPQLLAQMAPINYHVRIERLFLFHLQMLDWNCPRYIMPRHSVQQVAEYSQNLQQRIHNLEQKNQRPQQQLASKGDP